MDPINENIRLKKSTQYVIRSDLAQYDSWISMCKSNSNYIDTNIYTILESYKHNLSKLGNPPSTISRKLSNIRNHHPDFKNIYKTRVGHQSKKDFDTKLDNGSSLRTPKIFDQSSKDSSPNKESKVQLSSANIFMTDSGLKKSPSLLNKTSTFSFHQGSKSDPRIDKYSYLILSLKSFFLISVIISVLFLIFTNRGIGTINHEMKSKLAISNETLLNTDDITLSLSAKSLNSDTSPRKITLRLYDKLTGSTHISGGECIVGISNNSNDDVYMFDIKKYCSNKFNSQFLAKNFLGFTINDDAEAYPRLSVNDVKNISFYSYFDPNDVSKTNSESAIVESLKAKLLNSTNQKIVITPVFDTTASISAILPTASISASLTITPTVITPTP